MPLIKVVDHREQAVALLLEQFKGKPAIEDLVRSLVTPANLIETTAFEMLRKRIAIDQSEGVQLDLIGELLGQPRNGLVDVAYRVRLHAEVAIHASNGTGDDLINASTNVVANFNVFLSEYPAAAAEFEAYARRISDGEIMPFDAGNAQMWSAPDFDAMFRVINRARSGAVYFVLLARDDQNKITGNSPFAFDGKGSATFDVDYSFQIRSRGAEPTTPE